eukprot:NODE_4195_length_828_cov_14.300999_g4037_i0.p2 GENE.NODE_4195_length_828_cov_14.300999_g4037_i0~~NODE_4195_length_828_cov_14.300999_g4037_i0.p2  ORF type:complete len:135 (+),score=42.80 NODE_4195_length_828_cov_14.300999_g4037_i0:41-445(+)
MPSSLGEFTVGRTLGRGTFSKVKLGVDRKGQKVALKIFKQNDLLSSPDILKKVERESVILRMIHHPNVLQLYEVVHTPQGHVCMVLEYCPGGELFQFIKYHRLSLEQAFHHFYTILLAVDYIHSCCICHRDLTT